MKNMLCRLTGQLECPAVCILRSLLGTIPVQEKDKKFGFRGDAWHGSAE
jgi:hypothetical protein